MFIDTEYTKKEYCCIKIQAQWRRYYLCKELKRPDDNYTFTILNRCLDKYISDLNDQVVRSICKKGIDIWLEPIYFRCYRSLIKIENC